jgi:hypothetical protein
MKLPREVEENFSNIEVILLGADKVAAHAVIIKVLLQTAEKYYQEFMSLDHIIEAAQRGDFQIWLAVNGGKPFLCLVTELAEYPNKRVLSLLQFGGYRMNNFLEHLDILERWALQMGCSSIETHCREGLAHLLAQHGYKSRAVIVSKQLKEEGRH